MHRPTPEEPRSIRERAGWKPSHVAAFIDCSLREVVDHEAGLPSLRHARALDRMYRALSVIARRMDSRGL